MHAGMPQELACRVDVRSGCQGHSGESMPGSMKGVVFEKWLKDTYPTVLPKSRIPYYLRDGRDLAELLSRAWASRN